MKILVVDDDSSILRTMVDVLENAGLVVMRAGSGEIAMTMVSNDRPDLLITDLDLGVGMDGIELAGQARDYWPGLPILFMSGNPWHADNDGMEGRHAFLPKPFRERELMNQVHTIAGQH